jgi:hypothetical protein
LGFDDALLTAPLGLMQYVKMGSRVFVRSLRGWPWRLARLPVSVGSTFAPALAGGLLWWLLTLDESGRRSILATTFVLDDWLASRGVALGAAGLTGILLLAVVLLVARAMLDAAWMGTLRDTATGVRRSVRGCWQETASVFLGLSLIRLGLFMGCLMFLSPFFRVAGRMAVHEGATFRTTAFIGVSVAVSVGVLAYLSFFLCITATYLSYRPRFFAGTVIAGIAAPFRQWRQFVWIVPCYMFVWAALWLAGSVASTDLAGAWFTGWSVPVSATAAGFVAAVGFLAAAWFDSFLVALVGHRLGDVAASTFESNLQGAPGNANAHDMPSTAPIPASLRFEPPVRGLFVSSHPRGELHSAISFSDILSAEETPALPDVWTTGDSDIDTCLVDGEPQSGAVAPEISLQGGEPSLAAADDKGLPLSTHVRVALEKSVPVQLDKPLVSPVQLQKSAADTAAHDADRPVTAMDEGHEVPVDEDGLIAAASRVTFRSASGALERSIY